MSNSSLLLIDDDIAFTTVLGGALRRRGYEISIVNRLEDIDRAAISTSCRFDHILLDLMLGEHSTLNLIESLLAAQSCAKLIMLTGYASVPTTVKALKLGAVNYLAKPVGTHEVLAALDGHIRNDEAITSDVRPMPLRRVEWEHIQRVLAEHDGNITAAAKSLGMHRRSLQRKLLKRPPPYSSVS